MRRLIEAQLPGERPRLYVTVSVLHNPTGASLGLHAAHQRAASSPHEHGFHIVEDDTYAHLAPAHSPRLAALDALERTIYVSGFSKILAPNWRVGYLAAPPALVDRFVDTKLLIDADDARRWPSWRWRIASSRARCAATPSG